MVRDTQGVSIVILLLGGTSETGPLASNLMNEGMEVLVSTATEAVLDLPLGVRRRCGRLDAEGIAALCEKSNIRILVDAGHPFATELHASCERAASLAQLHLLRFLRPTFEPPADVLMAGNHKEAAIRAFALGGPVLLTIGSRNLLPYVNQARSTGIPILARVLDLPESLSACETVGLKPHEVEPGRGPFDIPSNRALILRHQARALVTKDSGRAGGLEAKLEAARGAVCAVILVARPDADPFGFDDPERLAMAAAALHGR